MRRDILAFAVIASSAIALSAQAPPQIVHVPLAYAAADGPRPNFSPKGTQVTLTDLPASAVLPAGATRPAKSGTIQIGPNQASWIPVIAAADANHPKDLVRLYLDRNRNGKFDDDGPALSAAPAQNDTRNRTS